MAEWNIPSVVADWIGQLAGVVDARLRHRLLPLLIGALFASGRRTVSRWLVAAGVSDDFKRYYYFLGTLGRKSEAVSTQLLWLAMRTIPVSHLGRHITLAIDDTPTKRYGPHVEGAGVHHNPTPGPAGSKHLYGHVWVTLAWVVRHPAWGAIALPLRSLLYVRQATLQKLRRWSRPQFATKLEQAIVLVKWAVSWMKWLEWPVLAVVDGAYAKRVFLDALRELRVTVVSRLRKDAALYDVPPAPSGRRGRPRKYGRNRLDLAKRAAHRQGWQYDEFELYGRRVWKRYKTFLATYPPAGGLIRVVIVREPDRSWVAWFSTDADLSVEAILEAVSDRAAIEQDFHDVKEVHGAGEQQVRNLFANIGAWHVTLWLHTLIELWAWGKPHEKIVNREARPWDRVDRRPSHADRRDALRREFLGTTISACRAADGAHRKIQRLLNQLLQLIA
ncbi:MAG TPA: transposase [Candidatus Saccharimonadales bacterium]|jgi:hypothetical protein|nr:transposase [Candidatus Saccharimonadales bacterium]